MQSKSIESLTPSQRITDQIAEFPGWRGDMLARLRELVHEAVPGVIEEWKWNTPVYSQNGMVCATGVFKNHVKINFFHGASLEDQHRLFNAGLDAKGMRSIDIHEGDEIDAPALKDLIRTAVAYNTSNAKAK